MFRPNRRPPLDYTEQTYASPHWIVRYPHQRRFQEVIRVLRDAGTKRVLDYGAGDGYLQVELANGGLAVESVAYEPVAAYAELIREKAADLQLDIRVVEDLDELGTQRFDAITCLAVLEHMPLPERRRFYRLCEERVTPGGIVVIDVPIEGGVSILVKEAGRVLLKGRRPELSTKDMIRAALGAVQFDATRFDPDSEETWIQAHSGFDHRLLERELRHRFSLRARFPSPLTRLPALLGNQEMIYVLGRRSRDGDGGSASGG